MNRTASLGFVLLVTLFVVGCGGGGLDPVAPTGGAAPGGGGAPTPSAQPLLPAVTGELIGVPGTRVPGQNASYVWTGLGWLGPDDDVVFEAVIQIDGLAGLGCGILRRAPNGSVNAVLMQDQLLPGTDGGRVKHPRLPLEARGDTLVIPADVVGGSITRGLFAVAKAGGAPVLLASEGSGEYTSAVLLDDGTVVAGVERGDGHAVIAVAAGAPPTELCAGCEPGFTTNGACVVVRRDNGAWCVDLDGRATPILTPGERVPGLGGDVLVTGVRAAWVTPAGAYVVHAETDDPLRPDVLLRFDGLAVQVVAACGEPAPGIATEATIEQLLPTPGRGEDVVFGARIETADIAANAVYRAHPGAAATPIAVTGDRLPTLDSALSTTPSIALSIAPDSVSSQAAGATAFGAVLFRAETPIAESVLVDDQNSLVPVVTTNAELAAWPGAMVSGFLFPLRDAVHRAADGRVLVHIGIVEDRRPDATLGALLLRR